MTTRPASAADLFQIEVAQPDLQEREEVAVREDWIEAEGFGTLDPMGRLSRQRERRIERNLNRPGDRSGRFDARLHVDRGRFSNGYSDANIRAGHSDLAPSTADRLRFG